jgi:hypothetical protein
MADDEESAGGRCAVCGVSFTAHGVGDMVLVPREMTEDMRRAAEEAAFGWPRDYARHYRAALAALAAPKTHGDKLHPIAQCMVDAGLSHIKPAQSMTARDRLATTTQPDQVPAFDWQYETQGAVDSARKMLAMGIDIQATGEATNNLVTGIIASLIAHIDEQDLNIKTAIAVGRVVANQMATARQQAISEVLDLLTAHELYQYRPKAFDGFIEYARTELALATPQQRTGQ